MCRMLGEERRKAFVRTIDDHADVCVPSRPRIFEQSSSFILIGRGHCIPQPVECGAERPSPFLIPARVPAGIASAIRAPALQPVGTAPRTVFNNLDEMIGGMTLEKLAIVGEFRKFVRFDVVKSVRQCHFPKMMMVSVTLAVGCNVSQLGPIPGIGKAGQQALGKPLPIVEEPFEGHTLRYWSIVEKNADPFLRG